MKEGHLKPVDHKGVVPSGWEKRFSAVCARKKETPDVAAYPPVGTSYYSEPGICTGCG